MTEVHDNCGREAMLTGVNGVEEVCALLGLADVGIDQERVSLGVDVLHHDLEPVEASRLGDLHLSAEALDEVLIDDTVRGGEESEDVGDEEALVVVEALVPVVKILGEIDLLGGMRTVGAAFYRPEPKWTK